MAWFKVDDHLYSHPKWLAAPKTARALWVSAGAWSAGQLLDGFIPAAILPVLDGTKRDAAALVSAGLWEQEGDAGWRFHDWESYQPTRANVLDKRAKDAERLRKWRENRDRERDVEGA